MIIAIGIIFVILCSLGLVGVFRPFVMVVAKSPCLNVTFKYLNAENKVCTAVNTFYSRMYSDTTLFNTRCHIELPSEYWAISSHDNYYKLNGVSIPRTRVLEIATDWGDNTEIKCQAQLPVFTRRVFVEGERYPVSDDMLNPVKF